MRVLVTGAAGFIGSHYVRTLCSGGYPGYEDADVVVLDKLTYAGNLANLAPAEGRFRFVHGDIADAGLLAEVLPGVDVVVNFAAETHVDRSIRGGADFVMTNVVGAQTLFEACLAAGVGRVLHVSTDEVYGSIPEPGSFVETDRLDPNSPYSAAKAGGDLLARAYAVTHGLNITVTRCSNNYGPYHFPEKVIPLFVTNLLDGLPVPLYGDGRNVRDWLWVGDHCRALALVAERGSRGEFYNIGGGRELSNRRLTELLLEATGRDWSFVQPITDPRGAGHDLRYSVDYSRTAALGYAPQMPFEEGLAQTVQWYRDNRAWWEPLRERAAIPGR
jgi:dTDP-glucose 4,6-dehydratase